MKESIAWIAALHQQAGTAQLVVLLLTALVVITGVVLGGRWYLGRPENGHGARGLVTDALAVVAPFLVGLLIVGVARIPLAHAGDPTGWLDVA